MNHKWDYRGMPRDQARHRECITCGARGRRLGPRSTSWDTTLPDGSFHFTSVPPCQGVPKEPLILIDVDGVLNRIAGSAMRRRLCQHEGWVNPKARAGGYEYRLLLNPEHGEWLKRLAEETGAQLAWGSMWEELANSQVGPHLHLPALPFVPVSHPRYKYFETGVKYDLKADRAVPWTRGRPFVWFEDDDAEVQRTRELAEEAGQRHLVIQVNEWEGLTEDHIGQARKWLDGLAARAAG